jgi:predicted nucleotidyltransferase component of viral defense system
MAFSARQAIELFHLVFLRALVAKGEDKALIALKGGCNLRFYFASVRYSEDIDLDVVVISKTTLRNKVDRLLQSPLVLAPLASKGVRVVDISAPKQTDTTQRWKAGLRVDGSGLELRTKIEFSRRGAIEGAAFEATQREVLRPYGLTPILATHYGAHAAIAQKIHALAGRTEPQARDVFDLNLLLSRADGEELRLSDPQRKWVSEAVERAMSVSFDDYTSKVVAFLDPEQAELFADRTAWDAMQDAVVSRLEGLR